MDQPDAEIPPPDPPEGEGEAVAEIEAYKARTERLSCLLGFVAEATTPDESAAEFHRNRFGPEMADAIDKLLLLLLARATAHAVAILDEGA